LEEKPVKNQKGGGGRKPSSFQGKKRRDTVGARGIWDQTNKKQGKQLRAS